MTGAAPLLPAAPPIGRQALALGVALGLHVAAALAGGDGLAGRGSASAAGLQGGAGDRAAQPVPAVVWLALPPAAAPDRPAEPEPPAVSGPSATAPEPQAPPGGDAPVALGGATGQLSRHGGPWTLAFPDIDLGAPRQALMMALQLDAARRVEGAEAVGPAPGPGLPTLATYVSDQLLGAELQGAGVPGGTACLEVVFDAAEARVAWRLREPVPGRQRCPRPAKA